MRWGTTIVDQHRSYPHGPQVVRVDNTDTSQLQAAARELQALVLHEQAHHLAEVHAMLAERYRRDGVQIDNAELEVQADDLALLERGDRFLKDVATRLHPGSELLELARQLDDHGLGVWRQAAGSLVDDCPPSLAQLRWEVEEEQRAELRSHAHLIRTEAQLSGLRRRLGLVGRWWHRRRAVELAGQLAECRRRRKRSQQRLAHLDAKLQVIDHTEHARATWIGQAREVLVRGVAAAQVLAERHQQHRAQQHQDGQRAGAERPSPVIPSSRAQLGAGS
jgi:HPt (histidine-containing phosphotransfer) domain-containing protein